MAAKQQITFRFKAEYEKASKKDKGVVLDRMCEIPCERPPLRIRPHDHDHDNDSEPHPPLNKTPQSGVKPSGLRKTVSPLSRLRAARACGNPKCHQRNRADDTPRSFRRVPHVSEMRESRA